MSRQLQIGTANADDSADNFINAWNKAEQEDPADGEYYLHFESLETLLKMLSPGRWVLLKTLRQQGASSIRALSKILERNYKNVHTDVKMLLSLGLIEHTEDRKIFVPWDTIEARLQLAA